MLAGAQAGVQIGVAVSLLVAGILLGYLIGVRGRNLVAALKALANKAMSKGADKDGKDGENENEGVEEDEEESPEDILEEFMYREATPGLDDHQDITLNPVVLYQINEAKKVKRKEAYVAQCKAEGMTQEEIDEQLKMQAAGGASVAVPQGKSNAFNILIMAGARVTPVSKDKGTDAALVQERKRQVRTIEAYLSRERNIDTSKPPKSTKPLRLLQAGGQMKQLNALQKAEETATVSIGEEHAKRVMAMVGVAKRGRNQLRDLKQRGRISYAYVRTKKEKKRNAGVVNLDDLANLQAEFQEGIKYRNLGTASSEIGEEDALDMDMDFAQDYARMQEDGYSSSGSDSLDA